MRSIRRARLHALIQGLPARLHLSSTRAQRAALACVRLRPAGPGDPPPAPLDTAVLEAGELVALRAGRRQVVMTQLHVGWAVRAAPRPGHASAVDGRGAG